MKTCYETCACILACNIMHDDLKYNNDICYREGDRKNSSIIYESKYLSEYRSKAEVPVHQKKFLCTM